MDLEQSASLYLAATVDYAYDRAYDAPGARLAWTNRITATATLNETNEPGSTAKYELGTGETEEQFTVGASGQTCYVHRLRSSNGTIDDDDSIPFACAPG